MLSAKLVVASLLLSSLILLPVTCLDNGLAKSPPMGWMSWERFRCITDCENFPDNCISEKLYMRMADKLVEEGYAKVGYEYVNIDDCWATKERDANGRLVPDPVRFPSGMKALGDYIHSKGLKFGIYADYGEKTCEGYPGTSLKYQEIDSQSFAEWGVDSLKLDGCNSDPTTMDYGYSRMEKFLNSTDRPILYSCSWPYYEKEEARNYTLIAKFCNLWRNYDDIQDSWESVSSIIDYYGDNQDKFAQFSGPGNWNDPDMLIIGNFGLTPDQAYAQMAFWSMFSAPLLMSNDLNDINDWSKKILQNEKLIAINKNKLGYQARRVWVKTDKMEEQTSLWKKDLGDGNWAFLVFNRSNRGQTGYSINFKVDIQNEIGFQGEGTVTEIESEQKWNYTGGIFEIKAVRADSVRVFTVTPKKHALKYLQ